MTEYELSRLVDGEMNTRDCEHFLQKAEQSPEHWREIALAFIEAQKLQEDFKDIFAEEEAPQAPAVPSPQSSPSWWSLAAAMVALLGLGYLLGRAQPEAPSMVDTNKAATLKTTPNTSPYKLVLQTKSEAGIPRTVELPAFDEETFRKRTPVTRKDGWQVAWHTDLLTGELKDGRRLVVPVSLPSTRYLGQ